MSGGQVLVRQKLQTSDKEIEVGTRADGFFSERSFTGPMIDSFRLRAGRSPHIGDDRYSIIRVASLIHALRAIPSSVTFQCIERRSQLIIRSMEGKLRLRI